MSTPAIFSNYKFGQNIFSQDNGNPFTPAPLPDNINSDLVLIVRDHLTGQIKLIIGDSIKANLISDMQFEFVDSGCGAFSFTLGKKPDTEITYKNWVEIYLYRSFTPWFTGQIEARPHPKATSNAPQKYGGHGFFNQLDKCIVDKTYAAGTEISAIAIDLMLNFVAPKTSIQYVSWKISPTGVTTTGDLQFNKTTAKQAFQTIADIAQNFVFGVDEQRHFFFKPILTDLHPYGIFFSGKHFKDFPLQEDPTQIVNRLYIYGGVITDGSNYLVTVNDTASQALYGILEQTVAAPEILDAADATRWGNYQLSLLSTPKQKAQISTVTFNEHLVKAEYQARFWTVDPDTDDYIDLFIKKTTYKIGRAGITMDMEVGELDQLVEDMFLSIQRRVAQDAALQQANVENLG